MLYPCHCRADRPYSASWGHRGWSISPGRGTRHRRGQAGACRRDRHGPSTGNSAEVDPAAQCTPAGNQLLTALDGALRSGRPFVAVAD